MSKKISVGIVGATGYTGVELVRLLMGHSHVEIKALTSRQAAGEKISKIFPAFEGHIDLVCEDLHVPALSKKVDTVFICLPHHESMDVVQAFRAQGTSVIDLSADFRIKNPLVYEQWYGAHSQKKLLASEAVYGLPELHRSAIKKAKLVASPGCYATSIILGLAPLLSYKMAKNTDIICDSKSGVSGAGRGAKVDSLFSEVNDNFKPYNIGKHRHTPEVEQELSHLAGEPVKILFSPHLVPMDRGILSTLYLKPVKKWETSEVQAAFEKFYAKEPFIRLLPEGTLPSTKNVRGTNFCHIGLHVDEPTNHLVVCSAIDNLTKGASGQAIQSFNLMHGLTETTALKNISIIP